VEKIVSNHNAFNDHDFEMVITRSEYEKAALEIKKQFEKPLRLALSDADMDKEEINKIVIVGGSTRTPWIKQWLKQYFDVEVLYESVNPDEGIAYGATMMAACLEGQVAPDEEEEIINP